MLLFCRYRILEGLARLKGRHLPLGNRHHLAFDGIASLTRRAGFHSEHAEAGENDPLSVLQRIASQEVPARRGLCLLRCG